MPNDPVNLGEFEGRTITKITIAVRGAGDGLSTAQKVEPVLLHQGDRVYVVIEAEVGPIKFKPIGEDDAERQHDLITIAATIIDGDIVRESVDAMKERVRIAKELETGARSLLKTEQTLRGEHVVGDHDDERVDGCPICDEEIDAAGVAADLEASGEK